MLTFEEYKEAVDKLKDEIVDYEYKIEYRELMIRKTYGVEKEKYVNTSSTTTSISSCIGVSTISSVAQVPTFSKSQFDAICDNDDELQLLKYKKKRVKDKLDFLRANGYLPES